MVHELKTISPYYEEIEKGNKRFEIRLNDRDYKVGDILALRHWSDFRGCFTREQRIYVKVTYILDDERFLQPGYVCMSIE